MQRILTLAIAIIVTIGITAQEPVKVPKASGKIIIDGKDDDKCWKKPPTLSFNHFYTVEKPTDKQATTFKMLWDDTHLYFYYKFEDQYITARETKRDGIPFYDDCAEVFLIPTKDKIQLHFGFELNLYKAPNDFVYLWDFYKKSFLNVKSYNPDYDVEVTVDGTINDNSDKDKGWTLEMAIPITAFKTVGEFTPVEEGAIWSFLALRQDRNDADGERRTTSTLFPLKKDEEVHNPKCFGELIFAGE